MLSVVHDVPGQETWKKRRGQCGLRGKKDTATEADGSDGICVGVFPSSSLCPSQTAVKRAAVGFVGEDEDCLLGSEFDPLPKDVHKLSYRNLILSLFFHAQFRRRDSQ